ncbi:MAG TPA: nuclear transport factor 2 family protein [Pseudomonadaceae bacterium]|nr:nuclear transport factor 2 family protein [Pseudomonadaceae bacterium]
MNSHPQPQALRALSGVGLAFLLAACAPNEQQDALQSTLDELQSREAIRTLFTDYGRSLDERDFTSFGQLFTSDAEYMAGGATGLAQGPEAIATLLEQLITKNATGANLHTYANEKITFSSRDSATALSRGAFYVQDTDGQPQLLMLATYRDELRRENGQWKFMRREVQGDLPGPANEVRAGLALPDIAGDWIIASSVGGATPVTVYCTLEQDAAVLGGSCTPEMANAEASTLRGSIGLKLAVWGYDVVFNGNPGRVDFRATTLEADKLEGSLSLSGMVAPFTAQRRGTE